MYPRAARSQYARTWSRISPAWRASRTMRSCASMPARTSSAGNRTLQVPRQRFSYVARADNLVIAW